MKLHRTMMILIALLGGVAGTARVSGEIDAGCTRRRNRCRHGRVTLPLYGIPAIVSGQGCERQFDCQR